MISPLYSIQSDHELRLNYECFLEMCILWGKKSADHKNHIKYGILFEKNSI